jgi:hypothetical protein
MGEYPRRFSMGGAVGAEMRFEIAQQGGVILKIKETT